MSGYLFETHANSSPGANFFDLESMDGEKDSREFAVFSSGDSLFGIDIANVREIVKMGPVTRVPLAPFHVIGVYNLRGRIITVIDLAKKLEVVPQGDEKKKRCIVVESQGEKIGLLVDRVHDVVRVEDSMVEKASSSLPEGNCRFFTGVVRLEAGLIGILNPEKLLEE
jgi:purine-binding chemotaxis protein CheW